MNCVENNILNRASYRVAKKINDQISDTVWCDITEFVMEPVGDQIGVDEQVGEISNPVGLQLESEDQ